MSKIVVPSIKETAFTCPHCGALTTQHWFTLYAEQLPETKRLPYIASAAESDEFADAMGLSQVERESYHAWIDELLTGLVFLEKNKDVTCCYDQICNLHLTKCYNCNKFAVWIHDRMVFPANRTSVEPNPDLPSDVIKDFQEAREIADASPRGAAALLRLGIQKLCAHLGEKGKNIDEDIGNLVRKGLSPMVQQALDVVRVIGNEAVHPGVIDLKDDRETALSLFSLVNLIAEQMLTHPKTVRTIYAKLPESKRKAIEKRDGKHD